MVRRYPCQFAILFTLGILSAKGLAAHQIFAAVAILAFAVFLASIWIGREREIKWGKLCQAAFLLLAFFGGAARMYVQASGMQGRLDGLKDGQKVLVQGKIRKKQWKQSLQHGQWVVHLSDSYLEISDGKQACHEIRPIGNVILYLGADEPIIGNLILVSGDIRLFQTARNEGNFNERAYYQNQGYALRVYAHTASYRVVQAKENKLLESLYQIQQKLLHIYEQTMPKEEAGVLSAMLLGEKSVLADETKELYRKSGILHILSISGLHISVLGAAVYQVFRICGISYTVSSAGSMGLLIIFGCMTGMGTSTMRAIIMFAVYLGAACCGRAYDSVNGLAVAAVLLLLIQPNELFLAGFQFSFTAVAGVWLGKEMCRIFQPKYRVVETVIISFGIQMLTVPLTAWYYFEIPVYAILLNLFVLPFMEMVLLAGLLGGGFGLLASWLGTSNLAFLAVFPQKGLLTVCTLILQYFKKAGQMCLEFPYAVYCTGQPQIWQMAGYFIILGSCILSVSAVERGCSKKQRERDKIERKYERKI